MESASNWLISGFSHLGKSHEVDEIENQDSFAYLSKGDATVLIVSDGAGSASAAQKGSQTLVSTLLKTCQDSPASLFENAVSRLPLLSSVIETGVERARHRLTREPGLLGSLFGKKASGSLHDFSATLVMVVSNGQESAIFHIGDGYAGASWFDDDEALIHQYLSLPQNGQFDNETYFFTDDDWRLHFRVTVVDAPVNFLFAMSDGADPFMIAQDRVTLDERVNSQLYKLMAGPEAPQLDQIFTKAKVHSVSHDDSTLLVARL